MVQVSYPGISPEDSERLLVKPLETSLRSVEGIKEFTARAYQGFAIVILEFDVNFNKQKALEDVRAQVDATRSLLPQEADPPVVREFNTSLQPVIGVALYGDVPERTLLKLARDLKDEIKTIPTVLDVDLSGDRQEMLEIVIDPAKLESYGISQQEMFSAVTNNNRLIAAGSMDTGQGSFAVKVPGVIENATDLLESADPLDPGFLGHAGRRGAGAAHLLRRHHLFAPERPADDRTGCYQAHRLQHHREQRPCPQDCGGHGQGVARGRARFLSLRRIHRHPRSTRLADRFHHTGHHTGDDHHRGGAGRAFRAARRALRFRPRS